MWTCFAWRVHVSVHICGGHLTASRSWFSPSTIVGSGNRTRAARHVPCSSLPFCCCEKLWAKPTRRQKVLCHHMPHFTIHQGGKPKQERQARSGGRTQEEMLFCFPCLAQLSSRHLLSQLATPTVVRTHLHRLLAMCKMFGRHAHRLVSWREVFSLGCPFPGRIGLCQVDKM